MIDSLEEVASTLPIMVPFVGEADHTTRRSASHTTEKYFLRN